MSRSFAPIGWPICSRPLLHTVYGVDGASRARTSIAPNTASSCEVTGRIFLVARSAIRPPRRCLYKHLLRRLPKCDKIVARMPHEVDTILVSSRNRISKIDRLCRRIFDRGNSHRASGALQELQERSGRRRLDNESLSFFSDNCVLSRQLEFARIRTA